MRHLTFIRYWIGSLLFSLLSLSSFAQKAQVLRPLVSCILSGPTTVDQLTTYTYSLSGSCSQRAVNWTADCGTIPSSDNNSATVFFNVFSCNSSVIRAFDIDGNELANINVSINAPPPLSAGSILTTTQATINWNWTPAIINASSAGGGTCGSFLYQWWYSTDNVNWNVVPNSNTQNLQSGQLTVTTWFKRFVVCGSQSIYTSNEALVTVYPRIVPGTITGPTQPINNNTAPPCLSVSHATGGNGSYSYQWQSSPDNSPGNWTDVGTPGDQYCPGPLTANTWYRVVVNSNGATENSGSVLVSVYPAVRVDGIYPASEAFADGQTPGNLIVGVSGGNLTYSYEWQMSSDINFGSYSVVSTSPPPYQPQVIRNPTYYRVVVTSNGASVTSATAVVTYIPPVLLPGEMLQNVFQLTSGSGPGAIMATPASGGNCGPDYRYQWWSSSDGVTYTSIPGAVDPSYNPGNLLASAWYKRGVSCGTGSTPVYTDICQVIISTQPPNLNYIRERDYSRPGISNSGTADQLTSPYDVQQKTQYFDGLGRPIQTVSRQASPLLQDMVSIQTYDPFDRESVKYLPYTANSSDGNYKSNALSEQYDFNKGQYPNEQFYAGVVNFEASALNRELWNMAAGNSWAGSARGTGKEYLLNTVDDGVQIWTIAMTIGSYPVNGGVYAAGQLHKTVDIDEQGHQVVEYKDMEDHLVLKKVQLADQPGTDGTGWLSTYYVYDDLLNLRYVIQPSAVEWLAGNGWNFSNGDGSTVAAEYCFRYEYDEKSRMIIKKVPGAAEVWMIYDGCDRLVFTQDGNLRNLGQWVSLQYDGLNRMIIKGLMNFAVTRDGLQQSTTSQTSGGSGISLLPATLDLTLPDETGLHQATQMITLDQGFTSLSGGQFSALIADGSSSNSGPGTTGLVVKDNPVPAGGTIQPLIINYYDNYDWVAGTGSGLGTTMATNYVGNGNYFITSLATFPEYALPVTSTQTVRGQLTGTMHLVLGEDRPLYTVNFYDERNRLVQARSMNYTGGIDTATSQYDFTGKALRNLLTHYKAAHTGQYHTVSTKTSYDPGFRVKAVWKNIDGAATDQLIDSMQYDELGQMKAKYLGNGLDSVVNDYNIRGWVTGINKSYISGTANHYFGMELGYDKPTSAVSGINYTHTAFNGNIAGTIWKSVGDGVNRKYDFTYDNANRLLAADYNQQFAGGWGKSDPGNSGAAMDYSVSGLCYDANGNIKHMQQNGFKIGAPTNPIDQLTYTYQTNSNKLLQVTDAANDPDSKLGDFHTKTVQPTGYGYDPNGNLTLDNNKGIDQISYNYLNLPERVHMTGKGTIRYTYDASGSKMQKMTTDDVSGKATATLYLGQFQYQRQSDAANPDGGTDSLQFAGHEEGRARWAFHKYLNGQTSYGWEYDFYERDHLGDTRVLLTQEKDTAQYLATMEAAYRNTEKALFFGLDTSVVSRATAGYPDDVSITNPNDSVTVLNGSGIKQGPAIILKVISGDTVDLSVRYFYTNAGSTVQAPLSPDDLLGGLAGGLFSITGGTHGAISDLTNGTTSPLVGALNSWVNDPAIPADQSKPHAYLNWILLDDQFRYVGGMVGTNNQSGALQVGAAGVDNGQLQAPLAVKGLPVSKSGYLYIYLSNTTEHQDVYFDNLSVVHYSGPMVEENHYYPFGLTMAGISDKALKGNYAENKYRFNKGSELQNKEFSDGSGLEWYDAHARFYDPQLGRFMQVDPKAGEEHQENWDEYQFGFDDPELHNDPNGDCPTCIIGALIGAAVDYGTQVIGNRLQGKSWSQSLTQVNATSILISAGAGAVSGGLSALTPKTAIAKVLVKVASTAVDAGESALKQMNENGKVSLSQVATDVLANKLGDRLTEHVKINSNAVKSTERQLDRATRIAAGDAASSGRAATVKKLTSRLVAQNGQAQALSKAASGSTANTFQAVFGASQGPNKTAQPPAYNPVDNVGLGLNKRELPQFNH